MNGPSMWCQGNRQGNRLWWFFFLLTYTSPVVSDNTRLLITVHAEPISEPSDFRAQAVLRRVKVLVSPSEPWATVLPREKLGLPHDAELRVFQAHDACEVQDPAALAQDLHLIVAPARGPPDPAQAEPTQAPDKDLTRGEPSSLHYSPAQAEPVPPPYEPSSLRSSHCPSQLREADADNWRDLLSKCVLGMHRYRKVKFIGDSRWRAIYLLLLRMINSKGGNVEKEHDMRSVPQEPLSDPLRHLMHWQPLYARAHHNHNVGDNTVRSKRCGYTTKMPVDEEYGCEERRFIWHHGGVNKTIEFYYTGGMTFRTPYLNQLLREIHYDDDVLVIMSSHRLWYETMAERGGGKCPKEGVDCDALTPNDYAADLKVIAVTLLQHGHLLTSDMNNLRSPNPGLWAAAEAEIGDTLGRHWVDLMSVNSSTTDMYVDVHFKGEIVRQMLANICAATCGLAPHD